MSLFYFTSYVRNMFRTLVYPSSVACDYSVELPHWSYCSWFDVCWRFGEAGLEWCLCCRLKPATRTPLQPNHTETPASQEIPRISRNPKVHYRTTRVRHLSLSWASPIQSIYQHPTSWWSILILSTHLRLGLPSGLLPSGFPTKTLCTPLSSPIRATCPAHLILLDFITRTILGA